MTVSAEKTPRKTGQVVPRPDARLVADALSLRMADLVCHFRGPANPAMSDRSRTAWGRKGSLVLHLVGRRAGRWDDYQAGAGGDGLDLVQHEQCGSLGDAIEWAASWLGGSFTTAPTVHRARPEPFPADDTAKIARAQRLWAESVDPRGTLVINYLKRRGLDLPDDMAGRVIRFHPACPWKAETGDVIRVPAMVSAMVDIDTNEVLGVHRTALNPDGGKLGKRMLGRAFGAAIKLDDDAEVSVGLSVGEGIETCLAARQLGFRPAWALGSSGAITRFPVLSGVDGLTLLAETDDSGANEKATTACAERWDSAGKQVMIVTPRLTGDMNDVLQAMRGAA